MKIWIYELGKWTHDGHLKDRDDSMPEHDDFLEANGFDKHNYFSWGMEYGQGGKITFHCHKESENILLGEISRCNSTFYFIIYNEPSFLMFKKDYKHTFDSENEFISIDGGTYIRKGSIIKIETLPYQDKVVVNFKIGDGEDHQKTFFKNSHINFFKEFGI